MGAGNDPQAVGMTPKLAFERLSAWKNQYQKKKRTSLARKGLDVHRNILLVNKLLWTTSSVSIIGHFKGKFAESLMDEYRDSLKKSFYIVIYNILWNKS